MSIEIKNEKDIITYDNIIIDKTDNFFNYNKYTKYEYNIDIFKNEIIANLPKLKINKNDLYVYIRSGDIFIKPHRFYSQPPLCFYKKILENNDFNKIFLITENMNNPVINHILDYFPNIIYNKNKIQMDISLLVHAYNIVGANSSFLSNILRINIINNIIIIYNLIINVI